MDFIIIPVRKHPGLEFMHIYNGLCASGHKDLAEFYFSFSLLAEDIYQEHPYIRIDPDLFDKIKSSDKGSKGDI